MEQVMSGRLMLIGKLKIIIKKCDEVCIAESSAKLKGTSKKSLVNVFRNFQRHLGVV